MLSEDAVKEQATFLWNEHEDERVYLDRIYDYARGRRGIPEVPDGANGEIRELARNAVKNICGPVVDAFAQNLAVTGFRSPGAESDAAIWSAWQAQRMDARQSDVHRAALTYGASYVAVLPGDGGPEIRTRSPRRMFAMYEDAQIDLWPVLALETWIDNSTGKRVRRGQLIDSEAVYPVTLGEVRKHVGENAEHLSRIKPELDGDPIPHGVDVCPVVRFINMRDADDLIVGEVAPLIPTQRAMNAVNFDRLVVSRFGAFPQRYVIGWSGTNGELLKASMSRVWGFDDSPQDVQVGSFTAAQVTPYNEILSEMYGDVAVRAQVPSYNLTGKLENIAADTLAAVDAPHQRKTQAKRESFGESWEQVLRLFGEMADLEVPDDAEMIWRPTEARAYGAVIDGVSKLAAAGVPVEDLLEDVPGWTQQRIDSVRSSIRRRAATSSLESLIQAAPNDQQG